jgi:thiamine-monophosphate kinase
MLESLDLYHYGRLTVLINVSDLAAMGANPLGLLVSTVMPEEMPVADYERFLDGVAEASHEWSCPIIGGNIKDGTAFTAAGSALGTVEADCVLRRIGTSPGDHVCIIGEMGLFWAAVLVRFLPELSTNKYFREILDDALYKPNAKIKEGMALARSRLATTCMDSSDGISNCLYELALVNKIDIVISSDSLLAHPVVKNVAELAKIDPRKLMFSWGNWELVCTIPAQAVKAAKVLIESLGTPFYDIGEVHTGSGKVWLRENGRTGLLTNFASERFSQTSFFTHGLDAYYEYLRNATLTISR